MTTTVKITHEGPGHNAVKITTMEVDEDGGATSSEFFTLTPGESTEITVYDTQSFLVEEGAELPV